MRACNPALVLCVLLLGVAQGVPTPHTHTAIQNQEGVVTFPSPAVPSGWEAEVNTVSPTTPLTFVVAVKMEGADELRRVAEAVSDPRSPQYTKFLTRDQLDALVHPVDGALDAVEAWLAKHQVSYTVNAPHGLVTVQCSVGEASLLLNTHFTQYYNKAHNQRTLRAWSVHLPVSVGQHVRGLFRLHGLPLPPSPPRVAAANQELVNVTPAVIAATYSVKGVDVSRGESNRQAVAEFQGEFMSSEDLVTFFQRYVPTAQPGDDKVDKFVGKRKEGEGTEAELDIQYIMGVAVGVKTEFWEYANNDFCADLKNWTTGILDTTDAPSVHSVSYGWQGNLTDVGCYDNLVNAIDEDFQKLAALGFTIVFASGDSGSGFIGAGCGSDSRVNNTRVIGEKLGELDASSPDECCEFVHMFAAWSFEPSSARHGVCSYYGNVTRTESKNGTTSGGAAVVPGFVPTLYPSWPASSPWVTSVGSTRFIDQDVTAGEMATDQFGSGGGFSVQFSQPSFQKDAVEHFLSTATDLPPAGSFPPHGRATPDVSALGEGFQVISGGSVESVGGTSASAPLFAGLVALLNEARLAQGKKGLGFLNPWLYQNADCFTDVVRGTDKISRGGGPLPYGYDCQAGWDPVTGLGTPIFPKLLQAALAN